MILDGCRHDTFTEHNTLAGTLSARISHGAQTPKFRRRNSGGARFPETVYVTANPIHRVPEWCDVDLDSVFHEVVDVWRIGGTTSSAPSPPRRWPMRPHGLPGATRTDGTTVVTSDHGNHLGEFATPFPIRLYGHPEGIRTPELIRVPWLVVAE